MWFRQWLVVVGSLTVPWTAVAQTELRVPAPPTPVEGEYQGAESVLWNPALLGDAQVWQVTYLHRHQFGDALPGAGNQGGALLAAVPVLRPLTLAAGFGVGYPADSFDIQDRDAGDRMWGMLALGLALRFTPVSVGLLYRGYVADRDPYFDGWNTFDLGIAYRPWRHLGLSFAISDLLEPRSGTRGGGLWPYERRYLLDLSVRPFGNDLLTIGASFRAGETSGRLWTGAGVAVRPLEGLVIRGRFDARVDGCGEGTCFAEWQIGTAIEVAFPYVTVGGGTGVFQGGGPVDAMDVVARVSRTDRPAVDRRDYVAAFRWTGPLSEGDWVQLVRWFEALARDDDVAGILLLLDGWSGSTSDAHEVRRLVEMLEAAGKPVWCYYDAATGAAAYLCAAADRTLVAPGGGAWLTGIRTRVTFFRRLLDRLNVQAEIVRVGAYKSVPESFTEEGPSAEHEEALSAYLDDVYASVLADLARDLALAGPDDAAALIDRGPFTSSELTGAGLADEIAYLDQARKRFEEAVDASVKDLRLRDPPPGDPWSTWRPEPAVAVVRIDGPIIDGKSLTVPPLGVRLIGDRTVVEILERLRRDPRTAAVVLRIDSGGGSAIASDNIWRAVMRLRERKPVVAAIGPTGASGAYYVAAAANEIFILPTSLTGSIGIFYGKADIGDLLLRLGVNAYEVGRGARATMESWFRPYTDEERSVLEEKIHYYYGRFLDCVVEGRAGKLTREQVDAAGQGRIWSGRRALELGLVDRLGGLGDAIARARELAKLDPTAPVFDAEPTPVDLVGRFLRLLGGQREPSRAMPETGDESPLAWLLRAARLDGIAAGLLPFLVLDPGTPMALCPYVIEPAAP